MKTLMDLGQEIIKIREAINSVEIRGVDQIRKNAPYLTYTYDKCNSLIQTINQIAEEQQKLQERQNGADERSDNDGESN
jgi:hypothetical protein